MENDYTIVIGAGAAGLIAAGTAAENGEKVLLLEKMHRPGLKILLTGNGRCNITNTDSRDEFLKHVHPNGRFLKHAVYEFFSADIINLLKKYGVETITESEGKIYPKSNTAADVLKALLNYVKDRGAEIRYKCRVTGLETEANKITHVKYIFNGREESIAARRVIICTGGKSYPRTGSSGDGYTLAASVGHTVSKTFSSLVSLHTKGNATATLAGLSLNNIKATLISEGKKIAEGTGEILFTHKGLSGPVIINLSRYAVPEIIAGKTLQLRIDLLPLYDEKITDEILIDELRTSGKKQIINIVSGLLPSRLAELLRSLSDIPPNKEGYRITSEERKKLRDVIKKLQFEIIGHGGYEEAVVTAGGVSLSEIDSRTMRSKIIENLFFAGEVLDLDGDTGGYNLQIAFTTGYVAGKQL